MSVVIYNCCLIFLLYHTLVLVRSDLLVTAKRLVGKSGFLHQLSDCWEDCDQNDLQCVNWHVKPH